jgi:hypothetical protein
MNCKHRAILIVTRAVEGTSTNVAKERVELSCSEPSGHTGTHHDKRRDERWEDRGSEVTHLLRHADET